MTIRNIYLLCMAWWCLIAHTSAFEPRYASCRMLRCTRSKTGIVKLFTKFADAFIGRTQRWGAYTAGPMIQESNWDDTKKSRDHLAFLPVSKWAQVRYFAVEGFLSNSDNNDEGQKTSGLESQLRGLDGVPELPKRNLQEIWEVDSKLLMRHFKNPETFTNIPLQKDVPWRCTVKRFLYVLL